MLAISLFPSYAMLGYALVERIIYSISISLFERTQINIFLYTLCVSVHTSLHTDNELFGWFCAQKYDDEELLTV